MAKINRGGKRATPAGRGVSSANVGSFSTPNQNVNAQQAQAQAQQPTQPQVPTPQVANNQPTQQDNTPSADWQQFASADDNTKAQIIKNMTSQPVPAMFTDNGLQRFLYNIELNDKPEVVTDAQADALSRAGGKELYRTINDVYDRSTDTGYKAQQIADQIVYGDCTRVSDTGRSAYGSGLYFADSYRGSVGYASSPQKSLIMRAVIKPTANVITQSRLGTMFRNDNSALAKACMRLDSDSRLSVYALAKGYDIIDTQNYDGYHVVLNRNALAVSQDYKDTNSTNWKRATVKAQA